MLNEVNDGVEQALNWLNCSRTSRNCLCKSIPYNPVSEHEYSRSPKDASWPSMIRLEKKVLTVLFVKSMVLILMQLVDNCVLISMKRDRQKAVAAVNP